MVNVTVGGGGGGGGNLVDGAGTGGIDWRNVTSAGTDKGPVGSQLIAAAPPQLQHLQLLLVLLPRWPSSSSSYRPPLLLGPVYSFIAVHNSLKRFIIVYISIINNSKFKNYR